MLTIEGSLLLSPDLKRAEAEDLVPSAEESSHGLSAEQASRIILTSLEDDKAEEIVSLNIHGKSSVADMLIVASGRSARHVGALADHVVRKLKEAGAGNVKVEGLQTCDWVLVDAGDVIVHLFRPEVRSFYNIERIWTGAAPTAARPS